MVFPPPVPGPAVTAPSRRLFALVLVAFVSVAGWLVLGHHLHRLTLLGVPLMEPRFADVRTITGAHTALLQGLDPLASNPGDPWLRPLNYPRIWVQLAELGIGPQHTDLVALTFFGIFAIGLVMLVPLATTPAITVALAFALFSPVTWLLLERANNDLVLFGLLAAAAFFAARRPRLTAALVGIGSVLKLYPIFGLAALCTSAGRPSLRKIVPLVALFLGYVAWTHDDLQLIRANTMHWKPISYGIDQLPDALAAGTGWPLLPLLILAVVGVLVALAFAFAGRCRGRLGMATTAHRLAAFRVGAGVFVGTFCLGGNFDYRLVFLLLVVPQTVTWIATTRGWVRGTTVVGLACLGLLLWSMTWRTLLLRLVGSATPGLVIDEALTWSLVGLLLTGLVLTMPDWLLPSSCRGTPFLDAAVAPGVVLPLPAAPRRDDRIGATSA